MSILTKIPRGNGKPKNLALRKIQTTKTGARLSKANTERLLIVPEKTGQRLRQVGQVSSLLTRLTRHFLNNSGWKAPQRVGNGFDKQDAVASWIRRSDYQTSFTKCPSGSFKWATSGETELVRSSDYPRTRTRRQSEYHHDAIRARLCCRPGMLWLV